MHPIWSGMSFGHRIVCENCLKMNPTLTVDGWSEKFGSQPIVLLYVCAPRPQLSSSATKCLLQGAWNGAEGAGGRKTAVPATG